MKGEPDSVCLRRWLFLCCFMVFAMAVIGAITRLTESGLSITEWKPVTGALPPLNHEEWERVFELYRQSPEFRSRHYWMELSDFQKIYFWEWLHRLWGRMIGLVYGLPLLAFFLTKRIPAGYGRNLLLVLALGAFQGAVGWWMVASGLASRPSVSHYRLAVHLIMALFIFSALWWTALSLKDGRKADRPVPSIPGLAGLILLLLTITWGAFVAGLDAGLTYNTFPKMDGGWLPTEKFYISGIVEQHGWVQFTHRCLAMTTGIALIAYAVRVRHVFLGIMVAVQTGLGIATLLTHVALPLAVLHQAGAIILLATVLASLHDSMHNGR